MSIEMMPPSGVSTQTESHALSHQGQYVQDLAARSLDFQKNVTAFKEVKAHWANTCQACSPGVIRSTKEHMEVMIPAFLLFIFLVMLIVGSANECLPTAARIALIAPFPLGFIGLSILGYIEHRVNKKAAAILHRNGDNSLEKSESTESLREAVDLAWNRGLFNKDSQIYTEFQYVMSCEQEADEELTTNYTEALEGFVNQINLKYDEAKEASANKGTWRVKRVVQNRLNEWMSGSGEDDFLVEMSPRHRSMKFKLDVAMRNAYQEARNALFREAS